MTVVFPGWVGVQPARLSGRAWAPLAPARAPAPSTNLGEDTKEMKGSNLLEKIPHDTTDQGAAHTWPLPLWPLPARPPVPCPLYSGIYSCISIHLPQTRNNHILDNIASILWQFWAKKSNITIKVWALRAAISRSRQLARARMSAHRPITLFASLARR